MKSTIMALVFILAVKITSAQGVLSLDENNKYIYYQVVNVPGSKADTLQQRGTQFLKTYPKAKITGTIKALSGQITFLTYTSLTGARHETGEVLCTVNVEIKDEKYRYWITGFVFTPYKRDRYGNFVPETGINIPLEAGPTKLGKREDEILLSQTGIFCKQFGERIKYAMLKQFTPKKAEVSKKVVPEKW